MLELLTAFLKTGSGSVFSMLFGILTTKIIAITLGPAGMGLLSLLRQTRDTAYTFTTLNGQTALVQGLASRKDEQREHYLATILLIMGVSTLVAIGVLLGAAPPLARSILGQDDPQSVSLMRWLILPVILWTGLIYMKGLLNGYRAIGRLALVQTANAAGTLLLAYPTAYLVKQGYPVAFVGMMSVSTLMAVGLALGFAGREGWLPPMRGLRQLPGPVVKEAGTHFLSFALTTLITGLGTTWTLLAVRAMIASQGGMSAAGIFDVAWTLSMMYLMLALNSFGTYYLPTLSQCEDIASRTVLIHRILRLTTLLVVPLITAVIVLKPLVVHLLYSEEFLPALRIMRWMLIGDYLKSTGWVFGVTIKAFADKGALLWTELLWQAGFLALVAVSLFRFESMEGIGVAFAVLYLIYLAYTFYYAHRRHQFLPRRELALRWVGGLVLLGAASWHTWSIVRVDWRVAGFWLMAALAYSLLSLSSTERKQAIRFVNGKVHQLQGRSNGG